MFSLWTPRETSARVCRWWVRDFSPTLLYLTSIFSVEGKQETSAIMMTRAASLTAPEGNIGTRQECCLVTRLDANCSGAYIRFPACTSSAPANLTLFITLFTFSLQQQRLRCLPDQWATSTSHTAHTSCYNPLHCTPCCVCHYRSLTHPNTPPISSINFLHKHSIWDIQ